MNTKLFTLRNKIYSISIVSGIFLIATVFISYKSLSSVSQHFNDFNALSQFAKKNISLSKDIESLKVSVVKFTYMNLTYASDDAHKLYEKIQEQLQTSYLPGNPKTNESIASIKIHLEKYYSAFLSLEKQLKARLKIQNLKRVTEQKIIQDIDLYFDSLATKNRETKFLYHEQFYDSLRYGHSYFETLDSKYIKITKESIKDLIKKVNTLIKNERTETNIIHLKTLKENLKSYLKQINKDVQHTRSYHFLLNVVMAAQSYEVNYQANFIASESQKTLDGIDKQIDKMIVDTIGILGLFGGLFILLLLSFSLFITQNIVKPISLITNAFQELVSGKIDTKIPTYDKKDEVGELTNAANSFLLNNQEINNLLESTKALTKELSINEERFSLALKGAQNGLWDWNLVTGEVYYSDTWKDMFGYADNEIGNDLSEWVERIHPEDKQNHMDHIKKYLNEETLTYEAEMRVLCKNETYKYVLSKGIAIKDENNFTTRLIGLHLDITDQKAIEEDLKKAKIEADQASKAKSDFLSNMSHEIRTPLNGIIGLTDLVLKTKLDKKQEDYLSKSKSSSLALLRIINDILDYSKIEAGKLNLEMRIFSLDKSIKDIKDLFEYQANQKGLALIIDSNINVSPIGDSLRLMQILTNLVGNAIKFTDKGSVSIIVSQIDENDDSISIRFEVKDTGIGIDKNTQEKLFSEFSQADNSITRKFGGSGLGLAISKQLVNLMDGKIWMESDIGQGSSFIFNIKFTKAKKHDVLQNEDDNSINEELLPSLKELHMLLVEDNKTNQIVAIGVLEDYISDIDIANNGQEAVQMASQKHYDIILMDLQMPIMDGFEATKRIKKIQGYKDTPIIALSAAVMQEDIKLTKEAGMDYHLAKPIDKNKLINTLLHCVS